MAADKTLQQLEKEPNWKLAIADYIERLGERWSRRNFCPYDLADAVLGNDPTTNILTLRHYIHCAPCRGEIGTLIESKGVTAPESLRLRDAEQHYLSRLPLVQPVP